MNILHSIMNFRCFTVILVGLASRPEKVSSDWTHELGPGKTLNCKGDKSEFCLNGPVSADEYKSFDDAVNWCKGKSSDLSVISDMSLQNAVSDYFNKRGDQMEQLAYTNLRLKQEGDNSWYLLHGSAYKGPAPLEMGENKMYAFVKLMNDKWVLEASGLNEMRSFICEHQEASCDDRMGCSSFGRCLVPNERQMNWLGARESCKSSGGDLATALSSGAPNAELSLNCSNMSSTANYWVGIRNKNLRWITYKGSNEEAIFYRWTTGKPVSYTNLCVCMDKSTNPRWLWSDCDCNTKRSFACLADLRIKSVPTPPPGGPDKGGGGGGGDGGKGGPGGGKVPVTTTETPAAGFPLILVIVVVAVICLLALIGIIGFIVKNRMAATQESYNVQEAASSHSRKSEDVEAPESVAGPKASDAEVSPTEMSADENMEGEVASTEMAATGEGSTAEVQPAEAQPAEAHAMEAHPAEAPPAEGEPGEEMTTRV